MHIDHIMWLECRGISRREAIKVAHFIVQKPDLEPKSTICCGLVETPQYLPLIKYGRKLEAEEGLASDV